MKKRDKDRNYNESIIAHNLSIWKQQHMPLLYNVVILMRAISPAYLLRVTTSMRLILLCGLIGPGRLESTWKLMKFVGSGDHQGLVLPAPCLTSTSSFSIWEAYLGPTIKRWMVWVYIWSAFEHSSKTLVKNEGRLLLHPLRCCCRTVSGIGCCASGASINWLDWLCCCRRVGQAFLSLVILHILIQFIRTTGGAGAIIQRVSRLADFTYAVAGDKPKIVVLTGIPTLL